jgi:hypothetical protein
MMAIKLIYDHFYECFGFILLALFWVFFGGLLFFSF